MDVRALQRPLKERYREHPGEALVTLRASASSTDAPIACSVEVGRALAEAQAHAGVGGAGTAACSGDLLLGALAACAQITCQMVAAAMGIVTDRIEATVEGEVDLRGTLGVERDVPVGFQAIRVRFAVTAPDATKEELGQLLDKTKRYCVVYQSLVAPPELDVTLARA
jgi:uncharacterized OsmC-like protein